MSHTYKATIYEAPEGSEIIGALIFPYFDNLASHEIDPILANHDLTKDNIDPDGWYPLQLIYDISREVSPRGNSTADIALGKSYAQFVIDQYQVSSLEQYFEETLNDVVHAGVRNVPDGYGFLIEKVADQHYRVSNNTPAANGLFYGTFWEVCRLLRKDGENFTVEALVGLRDDYLTPGIFDIKWG